MELAPLLGLLVGLVGAGVLAGAQLLGTSPLLASVLAVAALAAVTRGLHLDGLADLADGLGSHRDPEGARAVMKAPDVGAFGVAALVLVLLTQAAALQSCLAQGRGSAALLLAVVTGRLVITGACRDTPAAGTTGLGALVAQTVRPGVTLAWTLLVGAAAVAYAIIDPDALGSDAARAARTLLALAVAVGAAHALRAHAVRRLGGLTGDVLGALCEVATTVCLVVLATGA